MCHEKNVEIAHSPSSMFAILPTVLRSRIPPLASVQRRISHYSLRSRERATGLYVPCTSGNEHSEAEAVHTRFAVSDQVDAANTREEYAVQTTLVQDRPSQQTSPTQIGSHLLNAALVECHQQDPQSQAFSRQLYINGMAYLLQGLPSDLTEQEILHVQSALPKSLDRSPDYDNIPCKSRRPSVLHRGVATIVVSFCLLLRFALPYIKYFLAVAYSYERSHHIRENALAMSISSVSYVGKRGMDVVGTAAKNKPVLEVITYCIEGICGGLNEGLGEGIKAIDVQIKL